MATLFQHPSSSTPMEQVLVSLTRKQLGDLIEAALTVLDAATDPDLEDDGEDQCEAGDDGCGYIWLGHRKGWGADHEDADHENTAQPIHLN